MTAGAGASVSASNTFTRRRYLTGTGHNIYETRTPRSVATTAEKEARIIARLLATPHASLVAGKEGVSFATMWRLAEWKCIDLTAAPGAIVRASFIPSPADRARPTPERSRPAAAVSGSEL